MLKKLSFPARSLSLAVAICCTAGTALAHHLPPGMEEVDEFAETTFTAALAHPFTGADHWLAALAVGLMACAWGRKAGYQAIAIFVVALTAGIVAGRSGFRLPLMESGLAASVILAGVALAGARLFSSKAMLGLTACTGAWHGIAHGLEMPTTPAAGWFACGLVLSSAGIALAASAVVGFLPAPTHRTLQRWAGPSLATAGTALLIAVLAA